MWCSVGVYISWEACWLVRLRLVVANSWFYLSMRICRLVLVRWYVVIDFLKFALTMTVL